MIPILRTTEDAIAYGLTIADNPAAIRSVRALQLLAEAHARTLLEEGNLDAAMRLGFRSQLLREAHEAATRTGSIGAHLEVHARA